MSHIYLGVGMSGGKYGRMDDDEGVLTEFTQEWLYGIAKMQVCVEETIAITTHWR